MPRIDPAHLHCTIYLYPNKSAAEKGANFGGSGFLTAIPYSQLIDGQQRAHVYAVTNSHVIGKKEGNSPVIRCNRLDDKTEIISYIYEEWTDFGEYEDLAIRRLDTDYVNKISWLAYFPWTFVMVQDVIVRERYAPIDIGADVVMIGRFISFDGKQRNLPVVRFGSISMLPLEAVPHSNKKRPDQYSFLVETHTNPGTSGSPVFTTKEREDGFVEPDKLLGVVWGYSTVNSKILRKKTHDEIANMYTPANSGMAMVVPAWKLAACLYHKDVIMERDEIEKREIEETEERQGGVAPASYTPDMDETEDMFLTEAGFEEVLAKVVRPVKPKGNKKPNSKPRK